VVRGAWEVSRVWGLGLLKAPPIDSGWGVVVVDIIKGCFTKPPIYRVKYNDKG